MLGFKRVTPSLLTICSLILLSACGGGEPSEVSFNLSVVDGALAGEETTFVASQGDGVTLNLSSNVPGVIHLHGYDLKETVGPGVPSVITFKADATGRFALEMHSTGAAPDAMHEHDSVADKHSVSSDEAANEEDHDHDAGSEDFNLGALEIRPR